MLLLLHLLERMEWLLLRLLLSLHLLLMPMLASMLLLLLLACKAPSTVSGSKALRRL